MKCVQGITNAKSWSTANTSSLQRSKPPGVHAGSEPDSHDDGVAEPHSPDDRLPDEPWERRDPSDDDSNSGSTDNDDGELPDFVCDDLGADAHALNSEDEAYAYDERGEHLSGDEDDDDSSQDNQSSSSDDGVVIQAVHGGQEESDDEEVQIIGAVPGPGPASAAAMAQQPRGTAQASSAPAGRPTALAAASAAGDSDWWRQLPDFVPVDALKWGTDPRRVMPLFSPPCLALSRLTQLAAASVTFARGFNCRFLSLNLVTFESASCACASRPCKGCKGLNNITYQRLSYGVQWVALITMITLASM